MTRHEAVARLVEAIGERHGWGFHFANDEKEIAAAEAEWLADLEALGLVLGPSKTTVATILRVRENGTHVLKVSPREFGPMRFMSYIAANTNRPVTGPMARALRMDAERAETIRTNLIARGYRVLVVPVTEVM